MTDIARRIAELTPAQRALLQQRLTESNRGTGVSQPIPRRHGAEHIPSSGEERLWFLDQMEANGAQYNISIALHLTGMLDTDAVRVALNAIVARHEPLRTRYRSVDGALRVDVTQDVEFTLQMADIGGGAEAARAYDDGCDERAMLEDALESEARRPFSLEQDLLIRAVLYRVADQDHTLQLTMHHIASDGLSVGILCREFAECYNATVRGQQIQLPDLPIRYSDYARWMREPAQVAALDKSTAHWVVMLHGSSFALDFPTDRPRPKVQTSRGDLRSYSFSPAALRCLREFCKSENVTPFMVVLAAVFAVLHRYTGQSRIVVGSPMAARTRSETEGLIGFFTNTVALPGDLSDDPTFRGFVQRVRDVALDAYVHQDVPFEKIVQQLKPERDLSMSPVFQVTLVLDRIDSDGLRLDGVEASVRTIHTGTAKFDFTIRIEEGRAGMDASVEYNTDLFDADTIDRLWSHLSNFMRNAFEHPDENVSAIPLLDQAERETIVRDWNATAFEYPKARSLAELVEAQVEQTPDAIAVVYGETAISYRDLNERANQLAQELARHGTGPGSPVGLYVERSEGVMVALLAIIKSGAAYVPLDTSFPSDRLSYMMVDSGMQVLITERRLLSSMAPFSGAIIVLDSDDWKMNSRANLDIAVSDESLAYVIYTSGSTGQPKGVEVPRRALVNLLWSMREKFRLSAADRLLAITTASFDIAGVDIWLPWLVGATTVVASSEAGVDGDALRALIDRHDITFLQATPATWWLLFAAGWTGKRDLQCASSGEVMPQELAGRLAASVGRFWNLYGPTETTIWSTGMVIADPTQRVSIGRPLGNTQCYVLDSRREPQPIGVTGELYIAGDGVAHGYRNRPDLTSELFIPDPFARKASARMYRTGDLARYLPDGNIEWLGRVDDQVKIRGYRIELGEIEHALQRHALVRQAVVMAREDAPGDRRLVAYLVPNGGVPSPEDLRLHLKRSLPEYMIPVAYVSLDSIPLTQNGKVDRRALPKPHVDRGATVGQSSPTNPVERELVRLWQELLSVPSVGITDDFFELGGHSLLAAAMAARVATIFGTRPPLSALFEEPTIQHLAKALVDGAGLVEPRAVCIQEGVRGRTPFFLFHGDYLGGGLYCRNLVRHLDPSLPVYVLAPHLPGGPETIAEMAADMLPYIVEIQPHGPYLLGGYCNGGVVALEVAAELQSAGEQIAFLAVIEVGARNVQLASLYGLVGRAGRLLGFHQRRQIDTLVRLREPALRLLENELPPIDKSSTLGARVVFGAALVSLIVRRAARRAWRAVLHGVGTRTSDGDPSELWTDELPLEDRERHVRNRYISRAMFSYIPRQYSGKITVIGATEEQSDVSVDAMRHWRAIATSVEEFTIPGTHASIVTSDIEQLGAVLRAQIPYTG